MRSALKAILLSHLEDIARAAEKIEIQHFLLAVLDIFYLVISLLAAADAFDVKDFRVCVVKGLPEHLQLRIAVFLGVVGDEKYAPEEVIYLCEQELLLPGKFKVMVAQEENIGVVEERPAV